MLSRWICAAFTLAVETSLKKFPLLTCIWECKHGHYIWNQRGQRKNPGAFHQRTGICFAHMILAALVPTFAYLIYYNILPPFLKDKLVRKKNCSKRCIFCVSYENIVNFKKINWLMTIHIDKVHLLLKRIYLLKTLQLNMLSVEEMTSVRCAQIKSKYTLKKM